MDAFDEISLGFAALTAAVSFLAGATASVVGFGIGSLLTPLLAVPFGIDLAVAVVALPHLAGSLLRGWRFRRSVDRKILVGFGLLCAAGGLAGAFASSRLAPAALTRTLGVVLVLTAAAGIFDGFRRWKPHGAIVWALGWLSGFFGGVVGNQGGLRAAALSAFGLAPAAFVGTSTAIGAMIDIVRTPVYLVRTGAELAGLEALIALMAAGVLAGTLAGERILLGMPVARFRFAVSVAVGLLGIWFLSGLA